MRNLLLLTYLVSLFAVSDCAVCRAEDATRQHLLGDWSGDRTKLSEDGVELEAILTNDYIANVSGGIHRTSGILGNMDLTATVDTKKVGLWDNGTAFLYVLGNYGRNPSEYVGDLQVSDNIEAYDTAKIYEAWYNQAFDDGKYNLLFGLHDYNSEFDSLDYAGTLINSSFGVSHDISQVTPSIFPTTAVAIRFKTQVTNHWYVNTALYDGVAGDPNNQRGTRIRFAKDDGAFIAGETGLVATEDEAHYKLAVGGWYHTHKFEDFSGRTRDRNGGLYVIGEDLLFSEADQKQGLGVFFQTGFPKRDRNQTGLYTGGGFTYIGLLPERDADILSLGVAMAQNSHRFDSLSPESKRTETALELTYRIEILPYFAVQPDFQYIFNPGTNPELKNAAVAGVRTEIGF